MSEYERVILEHPQGPIAELRLYPTYAGIWYRGLAVAGQGSLRNLYNNLRFGFEWDAGSIRILSVYEGVNVLVTLPGEKPEKVLLKGNKNALLKRLRALFAANF